MRLLSLSNEEIAKVIKQYDSEAKDLKKELLRTVWYMRGGVTLDQAYMMSIKDLEMVGEVVKDNIDMTKKSGMPLL
jgi:hypothetical protein